MQKMLNVLQLVKASRAVVRFHRESVVGAGDRVVGATVDHRVGVGTIGPRLEREGQVPEELAFVVDLPASRTQFTCPAEFTALSDGEVKYEIIAKLRNGNQTAVESCFELQ